MTTTNNITVNIDNLGQFIEEFDNINITHCLVVSSGDSTGQPKFMPRMGVVIDATNINDQQWIGLMYYESKLVVFHANLARRVGDDMRDTYLDDILVVDTTNVRHCQDEFGNLGWSDEVVAKAVQVLNTELTARM